MEHLRPFAETTSQQEVLNAVIKYGSNNKAAKARDNLPSDGWSLTPKIPSKAGKSAKNRVPEFLISH